MADINTLSRQRLDFRKGPKGEEVAILTVTLGDKSVHRYEASADNAEVNRFAKALANAEMRKMEISGEIAGLSDDEIAGMFGKIFKAVKSVAKGARKIATSKVFKAAGKGLVAISPALGPFGVAAASVGGGMMVASKLADASIAAEAGAKRVSNVLSSGAKGYARKAGGRRGWSSLLRFANSKRKGGLARAAGPRTYQRYKNARPRKRRYVAPWQQQRYAPPQSFQRFRPAPWQQQQQRYAPQPPPWYGQARTQARRWF
jgi:hypothetical protein